MILSSRNIFSGHPNTGSSSLTRNHHQASTSTSPCTNTSVSTCTNNNGSSSGSDHFNTDNNNLINISNKHQLSLLPPKPTTITSNGLSSLHRRKPAPEFAAPKPQISSSSFGANQNRATQTLNRLEFSQRRRAANQSHDLRQNTGFNGGQAESLYWKPNENNSNNKNHLDHNNNNINSLLNNSETHIYAPASIAVSPADNNVAWFRRTRNQAQPNYNQTPEIVGLNGRRPPSAQSGRESSLASSLFGSLRRRSIRRNWTLGSLGRKSSKKYVQQESQPIYANTIAGGDNGRAGSKTDGNLDSDEIYAKLGGQLKAEHIYAEGIQAIDGNYKSRANKPSSGLENRLDIENSLSLGETRVIIVDEQQTNYLQLIGVLRNWLNDLLAVERIIIMDLQEDLYDGQIIVKLFEKLQNVKLDLIEVTQNESLQKQRLAIVLGQINRVLTLNARWARLKWSVEGIHSKNMPEIIHLLVFLAIYYRAPIKLPANVTIRAVEISKLAQNQVRHRSHSIQLTKTYETSLDDDSEPENHHNHHHTRLNQHDTPRTLSRPSNSETFAPSGLTHDQNPWNQNERDAFDELVDKGETHSRKLVDVCQSLVRFANRHLNKLNMSCRSTSRHILDPNQFGDGLLLVFLISSLENYFVPLGNLITSDVSNTAPLKDPLDDLRINHVDNTEEISCITKTSTAIQENSYINTHPLSKLHNVNFALQLIEDAGIEKVASLVRAEDIVNGDLKAVLRILYLLFSHYRHL